MVVVNEQHACDECGRDSGELVSFGLDSKGRWLAAVCAGCLAGAVRNVVALRRAKDVQAIRPPAASVRSGA